MAFKELLAGLLLLLVLYQYSCLHDIRILMDKKFGETWVDSKRYNYVKDGNCGGSNDGIVIKSDNPPTFQNVPYYYYEFHSPALDWLDICLRIPFSGPSGPTQDSVRGRVILKLDGVQVAQSGVLKDTGIGDAFVDIHLCGQIYKIKEGPHVITVEAAVADTLYPSANTSLYLPYCNNLAGYPGLIESSITPTIEGYLDLLGQIHEKKETKKQTKKRRNYDNDNYDRYYEETPDYYENDYYENDHYENDHYDL